MSVADELTAQDDWVDGALCAQIDVGDVWFPEQQQDVWEAKKICRMCPVQAECLEYALTQDIPHGIWGGYGARARWEMTRRKRAA